MRTLLLGSLGTLCLLLVGCQTTRFTTSATAATIRQEFARHSLLTEWEGSYVYGVGRYELGFDQLGDRKGLTLSFDPGPSQVRAFYFAHHSGMNGLFDVTDVVTLDVDLKPSTNYLLHCEAADNKVTFTLRDLATNTVVATVADVPVYVRPNPEGRRHGGVVPIFVPHR